MLSGNSCGPARARRLYFRRKQADLLKSKYLLPGLHSRKRGGDIKDLESRLHIYQQLKPAINYQPLWATSHRSFSRPYFIARAPEIFPGRPCFTQEETSIATRSWPRSEDL